MTAAEGAGGRRTTIADEQANNHRYLDLQDAHDAQPVRTQGARSTLWTGTGQGRAPRLPRGPLVGRVALVAPAEDLDGRKEYYIGARRADQDGLLVFSWAAPVACTFFRGVDDHPLFDEVLAIRTLVVRDEEVIDVADEQLIDGPLEEPFARRTLTISVPPQRVQLPRTVQPQAAPREPGDGDPRPEADAHPDPSITPKDDRAPSGVRPAPPLMATAPQTPMPPMRALPRLRPPLDSSQQPPLRAEAALRAAVEAPRGKALSSVLATLQPDQYDLVTRPARRPLLIQGHPGSGKTIVAAHRAAYLVHPESSAVDGRPEADVVRRILLIGPTDEYVAHVRGALNALGAPRAAVESRTIDKFLAALRKTRIPPLELHGPAERGYRDVDLHLMRLVELAAQGLRQPGQADDGATRSANAVYDRMRSNGDAKRPLTADDDWSDYLARLPDWSGARTERRLHPLIAACAVALGSTGDLGTFDHVIVDEAQDVRPLEWALIDRVNTGGGWTIVGDINQRRSDYSFHSWEQLTEQLGFDGPDAPIAPETMARGYRSTGPIMRFANALVPKAARGAPTLRESGAEPTVQRVRPKELHAAVATVISELTARHPDGSTAAIGVDPTGLRQVLRHLGWEPATTGGRWWGREGARVWVGHPDAARGLEFDAVVVSEPATFPMNLGRHGPLYTSLTRANRELVVVHSQPLPGGLRSPARH